MNATVRSRLLWTWVRCRSADSDELILRITVSRPSLTDANPVSGIAGPHGLPEAGGEDVEVAQVHDVVVVEVALRERSIRFTEVRGEDVEILEVHPPITVRVAVEEEEFEHMVGRHGGSASVGDAGGAERRAIVGVGEDTFKVEGCRIRRRVEIEGGRVDR